MPLVQLLIPLFFIESESGNISTNSSSFLKYSIIGLRIPGWLHLNFIHAINLTFFILIINSRREGSRLSFLQ